MSYLKKTTYLLEQFVTSVKETIKTVIALSFLYYYIGETSEEQIHDK